MKFEDFRDELIKRSIQSYEIPVNQYNHHYENIPNYVPKSIKWIIALYMSLNKKPFKIKDYQGLFEFKVK